jgi:hypothetical protein
MPVEIKNIHCCRQPHDIQRLVCIVISEIPSHYIIKIKAGVGGVVPSVGPPVIIVIIGIAGHEVYSVARGLSQSCPARHDGEEG